MKAKDLKNSILQLAIQGKLVPQDPKDEPASKLLEKIRAAKQKLVKEGKIKKDKQESVIYKGDDNNYYEKIGTEVRNITDEIPFEIPDSWEWVRLGNLFSHNTGKALNSKEQEGKLLSYITTSNLYWDEFVLDNLKSMYFKDSEIVKCTVTKGDLLVCEGGDIGRTAIWDYPFDMRIQNHIHRLRPYVSISLKFYYYVFYYYKHSHRIGGKGIAIQGLSSNAIHQLLIPIPPLKEQGHIVKRLGELGPYTADYEKTETELSKLNDSFSEQIKKSILQYAIQGKLVPQDPNDEPASILLEKIKAEKQKLIKAGKIKKDKVESYIYKRDNRHYEKMGDKEVDITAEIPFEIPNSWVWVRLGNVVNYGETPTVSYPQCQDKNMWILDLEDIEKDTSKLLSRYRIKDKKFNSTKKTFCKGNVLYCKLRPYLNKVMVADEDGICTSEIIPLQIYYGIVPEYLKECLKSPYFYQYVNSLTYGIKMPRLGTTNGKRSLIPLPPIQEQQRIVEKIEQLFKILP